MLDRTRLEAQLEIADLLSKCESYRLRLGEQLLEENNETNRNNHQELQVFFNFALNYLSLIGSIFLKFKFIQRENN